MNKQANKNWKDALLKTSLPLEYVVAEQLSDLGFGIQGEYHYLRLNGQGIPTEFSIDIWAVNHLFKNNLGIWAGLNYLIECKYCHPGIKWLFARHTKSDTEHLLEGSTVYTLDKLCTRQIFDKGPICNLAKKFPICFKGVELHQKDATSQNIERGRSQLRYGMPRLAIHLSEIQMMCFHDEELHIEFICPMLVTTAELFVLKNGLGLNDFRDVNELSEIASEVPALILTNPYSHLFEDYADNMLKKFHSKSPAIEERLEQLESILKKKTGANEEHPRAWATLSFDFDIREISQRILVVNYNSIEAIHKLLRKTVIRSGISLTQIGILEKDISKRKTWVSEYSTDKT
jgi:hypothetical protein